MNVELPTTGCNILVSDSAFYNYSNDSHTRDTYYIYDGQAFRQSSVYNQYGYTYTGTCLHTGDIVYKPELQVYFPLLAIASVFFLTFVIYHIIIKRLLP